MRPTPSIHFTYESKWVSCSEMKEPDGGEETILENMGICRKPSLLKWIVNAVPVWRETKLYITDTKFGDVHVRIYQPKSPSTGQRRGIIYLHGGAGLFGSIKAYQVLCRHLARESESVLVCVGCMR
ncbi:arylacetamide deacetylase-like 4 [Rhineura floridana]|uniref:arylacetamide deacetylase-like 4 n=1 Tax=Rhineura floridana TaxID=261503 RepID=UPI002AC8279D|nr:arylacetamide deacetylase-like 4 [Rhineura floridana]